MAHVESVVKDIIEKDEDRIFNVLQSELSVNFPIPNIRLCTELPQNARGSIDPETLDLYMIVSGETILKARKYQSEYGVKRDIREVIISALTYECGNYAVNILTDFTYSDYSKSSAERLRDILKEKNPKVRGKSFSDVYEERSAIEGRREGIAFFSQLKVLEDYRIDKRFEEIIFPAIYEKLLRSYLREAFLLESPKALCLVPDILTYSTKVVRSHYKNLLNEMSKPKRRDFVLKKVSEITKEEIEAAVEYLSARGRI